jgi:hypothetical protein
MLIPFDDYPLHQTSEPLAHAGLGHPDQYDRYWFNGFTEDTYFGIALGLYPNRGVIDAAMGVVHDGVQRSVFASGRIPLDRTATRIGPIEVEIVDPMRVNRVTVDAPEHGVTANLTARARTRVYEEPRGIRHVGTTRSWDVTRATQFVRWSGELSAGGDPVDLSHGASGMKDRSWGVRPVGQRLASAPVEGSDQMFFLWAPLHFDELCLHYMVHEDAEGTPWSETAGMLPVIADGAPVFGPGEDLRPVRAVRHDLRWAPGLRRCAGATLTLDDPSISEPAVELQPLLAFRMKGAGYHHRRWAHGTWHGELVVGGEEAKTDDLDVLAPDCVHVQQVVRASWGERTGLGVLEQRVVGPYAPGGFREALDGAPGH